MVLASGSHRLRNTHVAVFNEFEPILRNQLSLAVTAGRKGRLVPFVGAGISMDPPANLPSGKALEDPLKESLFRAVCSILGLNDRKQISDLDDHVKTFRLEPMLDALQQVHGRQFVEEYLAPLNADTWNENHAILAALANAGYIRHCITLNFDCLIELAFTRYGATITTCPLREDQFITGTGRIGLHITKLHGSFSPKRSRVNSAALLCGAISEIGDRPSEANRRAIREIIHQYPTLLIAGYSNHDWDIAPILFELRNEVDHILWIEHANDPRNHIPNERQIIVRQLLQTFDVKSTVIVAQTGAFLRSLARELDTSSLLVPQAAPHVDPDASRLLKDSFAKVRTATAAALILPDGPTRTLLLSGLLRRKDVCNDRQLLALLTKAAGMAEYSNVRGMVRRMRQVARLARDNPSRLQTDDNIWLGYQYLRRMVRPIGIFDLFLIPIHGICTFFYFRRGIKCAVQERGSAGTQPQKEYIDSLVTRARFFFPAQLPHGWAENLMMLGPSAAPLLRPLLLLSLCLYRRGERSNPRMMESEYFWMRHLQARILSGLSIDSSSVLQRLLEIEHFFCALNDNAHLQTVRICQALVAARDGFKEKTSVFLDDAEREVHKQKQLDAGSQFLILVYRRYLLGEPSLLRALMIIHSIQRRRAGDRVET